MAVPRMLESLRDVRMGVRCVRSLMVLTRRWGRSLRARWNTQSHIVTPNAYPIRVCVVVGFTGTQPPNGLPTCGYFGAGPAILCWALFGRDASDCSLVDRVRVRRCGIDVLLFLLKLRLILHILV